GAGWSQPERIFMIEPPERSNELWLLRDAADVIHLWWPVFDDSNDNPGDSATFHTQWRDGQWQTPLDVMLWPAAGNQTTVVVDEMGTLHAFSGTNCLSYVAAQRGLAHSGQAWSQPTCLDQVKGDPAAVRDRNGTIYLVYASLNAHQLRLMVSKDNGFTWSSPEMIV